MKKNRETVMKVVLNSVRPSSIKRKAGDEFMKKVSWCIIVAMFIISIVPRVMNS